MLSAPLPHNEAARLEALRLYQILDTAPEEVFDNITAYAAYHFEVQIALISLVDFNRQWFKSCFGLTSDQRQTGRDESFCAHAILSDEPLVIPDSLLDPRFKDNPLVTGEPYIRFYAGTPLITPQGYRLGTLCLLDPQPRVFSPEQVSRLKILAQRVMVRLKLRLANLALRQSFEDLEDRA